MIIEEYFMLQAALSYAKRGWLVLPLAHPIEGGTCSCGSGHEGEENKIGKHPMGRYGLTYATTDEATIREWWTEDPLANIGVAMEKSDLIGIDVDPPHEGDVSLKKLTEEFGEFPRTLKVATGRGEHFIFKHPRLPQIPGQLGKGIDVRNKAYLVAPPSKHRNGESYKWIDPPEEVGLADLPPWVIKEWKQTKGPEPQSVVSSRVIAIGERNETLFKMAAQLFRAGFPQTHVTAMLLGMSEYQCERSVEEPFPDEEVVRLVQSAGKSAFVVEKEAIGKQSLPYRFNLLSLGDLERMPPVEWQIQNVLQRKTLAMLYGPSGVGKTFACLDLALAHATSGTWFTGSGQPGNVVYVAAEGVTGLKNRIGAWRATRGLEVDSERFCVHSGLIEIGNEKVVRAFADAIADLHPTLIIFDTLSRCTPGMDENNAGAMGKVIGNLDLLRENLGATVMVVHHTAKNSDSERGSSALRGAMDTIILAKKLEQGGLTLHCEKQKDDSEFNPMSFDLPFLNGSLVLEKRDHVQVRTPNLEEKIEDYLRDHPKSRNKDIEDQLGLDASTISRSLSRLEKANKVLTESDPNNGKVKLRSLHPTYLATEAIVASSA